MGVQDLMKWVKTKYPNVIVQYPRRWADPMFRGKKVALDGTLLTNRFHFAVFDQPLEDKSALIGWYLLINDMRSHGVKPVAVWDEPGVRAWKALEARKRMANRALHLARKRHEQNRQVRLTKLKEVLLGLETLPEVNRQILEIQWNAAALAVAEKDDSAEYMLERMSQFQKQLARDELRKARSNARKSEPPTTLPESSEHPATPQRTSSWFNLVARLVSIITDLRTSFRPYQRIKDRTQEDIARSLKEEEDELASIIGADGDGTDPHSPLDITSLPPEVLSALDSRLADVIPDESYTEAPAQHQLTIEECNIVDLALSGRTGSVIMEDGTTKTLQPIAMLDLLIQQAPATEKIYSRAINVPTKQNHLDCRELLVKMGVPVLEAKIPYEAEGLASALAKAGLVDFVGSEDSDVIAYEAPLLRNVTSVKKPLTLIDGAHLRESSEFMPLAFRDFCILLGTDASQRIPKVGNSRADVLIRKHGSIEAILSAKEEIRERLEDEDEYMRMVQNARNLFGELPPIPEGVSLEQGVWKETEVEKWLEDVHGIQLVNQSVFEEPTRWSEDVRTLEGREPGVWDESLDEKQT